MFSPISVIRKVVKEARLRDKHKDIPGSLEEEHPMLKMDPHSFDQSDKGWRSLPGHEQQKVLKSYIAKHVGPGGKFNKNVPKGEKSIDPSTLRWHLGQTQAMSGKKGDAIPNMQRSKQSKDPQWNRYVNATTSFIRGDKEGFRKASSGPNSNRPTINRLKKGWGKDYRNTY